MPVQTKAVEGFPGYSVSSDGSVWSYWRTRGRKGMRGVESFIGTERRRMKGGPRPDGYTKMTLRKDGKGCDFLLHRLVLEVFVGPCPDGRECCHKDGDKGNCRLSNLYWGTRLENIADAIRHGTFFAATKAAALVNRGCKRSQEVRDKIGAGHRGKPKSEAHKAATKATHWSKRPDAAEIIERMASKLRGRKLSDEHRANITNGNLRRWHEARQKAQTD